MIDSTLGRKYILSRAVEDPIDATFELGEDVTEQTPKLKATVNLSIATIIIFLGVLVPAAVVMVFDILAYFAGRVEITENFGTAILSQMVLILILFSMTLTVLLFLAQIRRFYDRLFERYRSVSGLKNTDVRNTKKPAAPAVGEAGKYRTNPILAMLDLAEDAVHQLHKVIHLLTVCRNLIAVIIFFNGLLILNIFFNRDIFIILTEFELVILVVPEFLLLFILFKLESSRNFVSYFHLRHEIIDGVRFGKPNRVPEGADPLARLIKFLKDSDPFIKKAASEQKDDFKFDVKLSGKNGELHNFDAYFEGTHAKQKGPAEQGIPSGKFAVFIKVFKHPVSKKDISGLRTAVNDICEFSGTVPLRTILLQWEIGELDDEAYEFVLENPIIIKNNMFHLQLAAEDDDTYSFVPIIAYEREAV